MQRSSSVRSSSRRSSSGTNAGAVRFDPYSVGGAVSADNRQAVVIEIGYKLTKLGFAGEFTPRAIIRTEYIDNLGRSFKVLSEDTSFNVNAEYHQLIKLFQIIFFKNLLTVARDRRIVIVESILEPTERRNLIARILFEIFEAASILFAPSHLLATIPFGTTIGLVVDVGYRESLVVPVLEGVTLLNNCDSSNVGSWRVEQRIRELLHKYAKVIGNDGEERKLNVGDELLLEKHRIYEDIMTRFCFVTTPDRGKMIQAADYDPVGNLPAPPCDIRLPCGNEILIVPGIVREWSAETIFEFNDDIRSLPQVILDCILKCPIDCRRGLLESIILVGGFVCMKGFYARLLADLRKLLNQSPYSSKLEQINSIKFFLLPKTRTELYGSWLGGSMFGSLEILQYRSMSKEEWISRKDVRDWTSYFSESCDGNVKERAA